MMMSENEILGTFIIAFLGFFIIMLVVGLILYILQAIGLFKIAKREGRAELAWLAWIPIASTFLMTLIVENNVHKEFRGKMTLIYGIAFAASIILSSFIPFVGFFPIIVLFFEFYFFVYNFSNNYCSVLCILLFCSKVFYKSNITYRYCDCYIWYSNANSNFHLQKS